MEDIRVDRFRDRQSKGVFSEVHIAKLTNLPIQLDADTQTDPFHRHKQLRFPMKEHRGVHKSVQVDEADIFDFDRESAPIVKMLVNNILEEARIEAWDQGQAEHLTRHKQRMDRQEQQRIREMRRFEEVEKEKRDQARLRRMARQQAKAELVSTHEKLIGRELSKAYISSIHAQASAKIRRMQFKTREKVQQKIQSQLMVDVEHLIYGRIGEKEQIRGLLGRMAQEARGRFKEQFRLETVKFKE